MGRLRKHPGGPSKYNLPSILFKAWRTRKLSQMFSWLYIVSGGWYTTCGSTRCVIFPVLSRLVQLASGIAVSYFLEKFLSRLARCTINLAT